jgi:hypothetical protein
VTAAAPHLDALHAPALESIFDAPLQDLTLDRLERFLADADREPLLWAATGGEHPQPEAVRRHVSGLANGAGGWLIIGVEEQPGGFRAGGADFGDREPEPWLSDVIAGLRPRPSFEVKVLDAGVGRRVAIAQVEPIAVAPCVTPGGGVYQRVAGDTVPVRAPLVLMDLVRRGEAALERARR